MLKYISLFFSVTVILSSCKGDKVPNDVIDPTRMVNLMTEVHIMDGGLYRIQQDPDTLYKYGIGKFVALFKKYHTDSVRFRKSLAYYTTQPFQLQKMYEQIQVILKQKSDSLNKIQFKPNAIPKK